MKNIASIKIISVDLFRTLVRVDDGFDRVWNLFLGRDYTPQLGQYHWDRTTEVLLRKLDEAAANPEPFMTTADIFTASYAEYFKTIGMNFDPRLATEALMAVHSLNNFFSDAAPFLEAASRRYRVCLSTDCDTRMLKGIERLFRFEKMFVSEELRAYKAHPRFFRQVLDYYQVEPQAVLHIGDSKMDILTPSRSGLQTCWLDRSGKLEWKYDVQPDFKVRSLTELQAILKLP